MHISESAVVAKLNKTLLAAVTCTSILFAGLAFAQAAGTGGAAGAGAAGAGGTAGAAAGAVGGAGTAGATAGSIGGAGTAGGTGTTGTNGGRTSNAGVSANSSSASGPAGGNGIGSATALGGNGIVRTTNRTRNKAGTRVTANDVLSSEIQLLCSNMLRATQGLGTSGPAGTTSVAAAEAARLGGAPITGMPAAKSTSGGTARGGHSICHRDYAMARNVTHHAVRHVVRNFLHHPTTARS